MNQPDHPSELFDDVRRLLERAAQGSRRAISLAPEIAEALERGPAPRPAEEPPAAVSEPAPDDENGPGAALRTLAAEVAGCRQCGLCETRTQTVFGAGNPQADLVFVGEAPGYHEDRQGIPFVGRAGQLLTDIIEKGMKLSREEVYICNVLKCRPPGNRDPNPHEVAQCEPWLLAQLDVLRPKVIVALGKYAGQTLLKNTLSVGRLRGQWWEYHGIPLRVTYHPAYLLRNPADKKGCWEDVQHVMKLLRGETAP